ncbi:MAG: dihydroneopterin aldolase [Candidatus Eremiobacteraeota bacterium]|nr:dihydroneopterin aldolase [Candidatus Eremiobacteraeota bacterium]
MTDRIELRGVRAWGRHGANAGERDVPQPFDVDVAVELDLGAARASDRLADTLDYAALHAAVVRVVALERCALLERLGELVLAEVFGDPRVVRARVAVAKPGLLAGATPVVTLERSRSGR